MAVSFLQVRQPEGAPLSRPGEAATNYTMTRRSQPEDDRGSEGDGREEGRGVAIVAGGDAPPILEAAEHDLDAAAAPVAALVVSDRLVARSAARDAGLDAFGIQGVPEPVCIIAAVTEQPLCFWQIIEQC